MTSAARCLSWASRVSAAATFSAILRSISQIEVSASAARDFSETLDSAAVARFCQCSTSSSRAAFLPSACRTCSSASARATSALAASFTSSCCTASRKLVTTSGNTWAPTTFTRAFTSICIARAAKSRVLTVSWLCSSSWLAHASRTVLQFPPIASLSKSVSLLSRKGICGFRVASALTTLPSASKLLLIAVASLNLRPSAPLFLTRSEPARSTMFRQAWKPCTPS
mmetsp:Transcript_84439/g.149383  ORF Transcript_84439/g.149383 Transcript_84439/m.149383 type:complete len:226 (+) Transcript_84439:1043-1720(+)